MPGDNGTDGFAPMHAAARGGNTDILSLLLEHGADVDSRDVYGRTPLIGQQCVEKENSDVGQYLLDHGADINARDTMVATPLLRRGTPRTRRVCSNAT
jgi:ankyrin repeat protein